MTVGEKIRFKRKEKKLTQKALGELCGMSGELVSQYESGTKQPKIVTLKKIALALDIKTNYFLDMDSDEETLFEKMTGINYRQIKIYADALEMSVPEFMGMITKQSIEFIKAGLLGKNLVIVNDKLAELDALGKTPKEGN